MNTASQAVASDAGPSVLNQALVKIIEKATAGIDSAVGFISTQIPDVLQQLLVWHFTKSLIWFVLSILAVIVSIVALKRIAVKPVGQKQSVFWEYKHGEPHDQNILAVIAGMAAVFIAPISVGSALSHLDWLQIWIAPKIWLIEYAVRLAKSV